MLNNNWLIPIRYMLVHNESILTKKAQDFPSLGMLSNECPAARQRHVEPDGGDMDAPSEWSKEWKGMPMHHAVRTRRSKCLIFQTC